MSTHRSKSFSKRFSLATVILIVLAVVTPSPSFAKNPPPSIAPIQSHPHGKTYGEWAAAWWQWGLGASVDVNPLLDETGAHCAVGQTGHVWFLAGTLGSGVAVERSCTIPTGTALFFPLINSFIGAFLNDPPETRTEEFLRAQVECEDVELSAFIDGVRVDNPYQYFEQSPLFDVQLPENNLIGVGEDVIPELRLSPSVDQGYYLFLHPLPPGKYTIHWVASQTCDFGGTEPISFSEDITYHITVKQGKPVTKANMGLKLSTAGIAADEDETILYLPAVGK